VPCAPVNDVRQALADPQVLARDMIVDVPHKQGETTDLRAYLKRGDTALTETLLYQFL